MAATFEEVVRAWLLHYDDRLPNDRKDRRAAFIILLGNLADHGYDKDSLVHSRKEKIVVSCVNPNHRDKKRLKRWASLIVNDLEAAILIYYPTVTIREDVITPEMDAKLSSMQQRAEETKALRKIEQEPEQADEEDFSIEDSTKLDVYKEIKEEIKRPTKPGEDTFEITDEMLGDDEESEVIYDKDFMKRLGLE